MNATCTRHLNVVDVLCVSFSLSFVTVWEYEFVCRCIGVVSMCVVRWNAAVVVVPSLVNVIILILLYFFSVSCSLRLDGRTSTHLRRIE